MSTKTLGVVDRGSGRQKVGIKLGSCELYPNYSNHPNYPNSLGMFQTKAQMGVGGSELYVYSRSPNFPLLS